MLKLGIVGDLSLQDPSRLERCLTAVFQAAHVVVLLGDCHPAYRVVDEFLHAHPGHLLTIPGDLDEDYDSLGQPRQWTKELDTAFLIGLDNSSDEFSPETWTLLDLVTTDKRIFVFVHKPLSRIMLPDGTESGHIMGESVQKGIADAKRLEEWLKAKDVELLVCGHHHSWAFYRTKYADCLIEGRGGAAPELGFTLALVAPDTWTLRAVTL